MAVLEAKTDNSSNESLFPDEKSKANNRINPAFDYGQGHQKRAVSLEC